MWCDVVGGREGGKERAEIEKCVCYLIFFENKTQTSGGGAQWGGKDLIFNTPCHRARVTVYKYYCFFFFAFL